MSGADIDFLTETGIDPMHLYISPDRKDGAITATLGGYSGLIILDSSILPKDGKLPSCAVSCIYEFGFKLTEKHYLVGLFCELL